MRGLSLICLILMASPAVADVAPPPPASEADGVWSGTMSQYEPGRQRSYAMTLTIADDAATSDYPKLNCGGELTKMFEAEGYVIFRETITRGRYDEDKGGGCIDGFMTLRFEGDRMQVGWFTSFDGDAIVAAASLEREVDRR